MNAKAQWVKENLKDGELYAGIILGKDGAPDHHLILLPGGADNIKWDDAVEWAEKVGGELPTRREQSLLFANLEEQFPDTWYWSNEQRADNSKYAWYQNFTNGTQLIIIKSSELRARAVRRVAIL